MKPSLIFDYDGTIHDTIRIYEPSLRKVLSWLEEQYEVPIPPVNRERIASWMGMNRREMWESFLPQLPFEVREQAGAMVGKNIGVQIREHKAAWYPGIRETLDILKNEGYRMAVLSNCQNAYARSHWEEFGMERWFTAFYDCESYDYAPKTEIIRQLEQVLPKPDLVIGDRKKDLECARSSGSRFIGCLYGFGTEQELKEADALADRPEDLAELIRTQAEHSR